MAASRLSRMVLTPLLSATLAASPALAAQDKPMTDDDPDAVDVAKTPVTDLNIDKKEIPAILLQAQARPYSLTGLGRCKPLIAEVSALDDVLGPDLDLPEEERARISAGRVAKTVVGSFIPFRGLIREVSGANDHDRKVRAAIQAGLARRGFLKGIGQARGCAYPARPATTREVDEYIAKREAQGVEKDPREGGEE
ncbi:MAG: hypothetical protein KDE25_01110 [Novosphingobium sp.]|nr:hypothetical protein [Novosphingobium sp.]